MDFIVDAGVQEEKKKVFLAVVVVLW